MRRNLWQLWLRLHRWVALSIGWLLIVSGLTGALLVAARPLDQWLHPKLFSARSSDASTLTAPLAQVAGHIRAEFGPSASFTLRPPRQSGDTLWALVRGPWSGTVYFDPATGVEQGRRGETEGFLNTLFKLHSALLLDQMGKAVLAWSALAYLLLLIAGLILWWPQRWPPSWKIAWGGNTARVLFDLHRVLGAALGLLVAVSVATGAYMAWRPLGEVVTTLVGGTPLKPPAVPASATGPSITLDEIVVRALARFPEGRIGYVQVPAQTDRPVRIRLMLPDDPHPNGLTSVWLHPRTGDILAAHRWNELDPGAKAVAVVYPLHTGELGGPLLEVFTAANGLILATLGISGIWLWWRRRRMRKKA